MRRGVAFLAWVLMLALPAQARQPYVATADLLTLYSAVGERDGAQLYENLGSKARQELWTLHLRRALTERAVDLSPEQRAVIFHGLGFLAAGSLSIERESPDWDRLVGLPLALLDEDARNAFEPAVARAIFGRLGAAVSMRAPAPCVASGSVAASLVIETCSCSRDSDWCDWVTNPNPICREVICEETSSGCGTFWAYECDGVCGS
jgi:hypothetical protein